MNNTQELHDKIDEVCLKFSALANALDFFYGVFANSINSPKAANTLGMCDMLYILNEYAQQIHKELAEIDIV